MKKRVVVFSKEADARSAAAQAVTDNQYASVKIHELEWLQVTDARTHPPKSHPFDADAGRIFVVVVTF